MKTSFFKSLIASAAGKYSSIIVTILINIVLSRILSPKDFGIAAVGQVFLVFFDMLTEMGIGSAIVQRQDLEDKDYQVFYRLTMYMGAVGAALLVILSYPMSLFWDEKSYIGLFLALGLDVFVQSLYIVPFSYLKKALSFTRINQISIIGSIVKCGVSIGLALIGFRFYAIILGIVIEDIVLFFLFHKQYPMQLRTKWDSEPVKKIKKFASEQFLFNFVNYFSRHLDTLLIGKFFGAISVGYYTKSYQTSQYPNSLINGVLSPVVHPMISRHQNNISYIEKLYLKFVEILTLIGMPASVYVYFYSKEILFVLFGNQWLLSADILRIFSVSIWIQLINSASGSFYQATNRTDLLLFSGIQSSLFNVFAIIVGILLGKTESIATGLVVTFGINFLINHYLLFYKVFKSSWKRFLSCFWRPLLVAALLSVLAYVLPLFIAREMTVFIVYTLILLVVFVILFLLSGIWKKPFIELAEDNTSASV